MSKKVVYANEVVKENTDMETVVVIEEYPDIDYTLLRRDASFQPYVAAWGLNKETGNWNQGHYFEDLFDALNYIRTKRGKISYWRMDEIASKAIDGLFEDDPWEAEIYCEDTLELDDDEKEYFGINNKFDESEDDDYEDM